MLLCWRSDSQKRVSYSSTAIIYCRCSWPYVRQKFRGILDRWYLGKKMIQLNYAAGICLVIKGTERLRFWCKFYMWFPGDPVKNFTIEKCEHDSCTISYVFHFVLSMP
jgi:hypothetical protein